MKYWIFILIVFLQPSSYAKAKIVTTFSVLEDIVNHLVDDDVEVANLVSGGTDPHLFEPGPREINQVRSAKIIFANGLHFEPWLDRLINSASKDLKVVYVSRNIKPRKLTENGLQIEDPHAWNSPRELITYIQVISDELRNEFPKKAASIRRNSVNFTRQIEIIDAHFSKKFAKVPENKRVLLTTHDAAGYLSQSYSIKSISPIGLSTSEDFKTADLAHLLLQIREYKVKVIFTEPSHHKLLTERLAQKADLQLGPELYLDGLSAKGTQGDTIEKMLNHNLESILSLMK